MEPDGVIIKRIDAEAVTWPEEIDRLRNELGAPNNPLLFPAHFLKATFPKIGGISMRVEAADRTLIAGCFLFPRAYKDAVQVYTLRYHAAPANNKHRADLRRICQRVELLLGGDWVVIDDPAVSQTFSSTSAMIDGIDIGSPDAHEAIALRELAREIWETNPDGLYPLDVPADEFGPGTALVARLDGVVAGFLLGFFKFGGPPLPEGWRTFDHGLRIESQLLGVNRRTRQHGLGTLLKRVQGQQAAKAGIDIVNWTVDPLQFGNAVLNFGRLRAVAFDFLPDYYPFRNALNRVPASRLAMTWLVRSDRVRNILTDSQPAVIQDLSALPRVRRLNDGATQPVLEADDPMVAIEIPAHWTALQRDDLPLAQAWRVTTDQLFQRYLGPRLGDYLLIGVAVDGERRYLIGQQIDAGLIAEYGNSVSLHTDWRDTNHAD